MVGVAVIEKIGREQIQIERKRFRGQPFVCVREFYRVEKEMRPGRQGLALAPDLARQIAEAMIEAATGNGGENGE